MCRTGVLLDSSLFLLVTGETQGLETSEWSLQSPRSLGVDLRPYICSGSHRPPAVCVRTCVSVCVKQRVCRLPECTFTVSVFFLTLVCECGVNVCILCVCVWACVLWITMKNISTQVKVSCFSPFTNRLIPNYSYQIIQFVCYSSVMLSLICIFFMSVNSLKCFAWNNPECK